VTKPAAVTTPYPEINSVLQELLSGVRAILGRRFVGMYLDGSLAIGDFEPDKSDLDFVVVTDGELSAQTFRDLKALHERIATGASKWTKELEGSYIPQRALRHDRRPPAHPYIDRGSTLAMVHQESGYWVIHRHILREHGVVLTGPPPRTLIDPVPPTELREAVLGILREWWMPMLVHAPCCRTVSIGATQSSRWRGCSTPFATGRSFQSRLRQGGRRRRWTDDGPLSSGTLWRGPAMCRRI
jgi:hypothetical protein